MTPAPPAQSETYSLDPKHTLVAFTIRRAGFSNAIGPLSGSTGTLRFDQNDWHSAQLNVTVPVTRLEGNTKWSTAAFAAKLLDSEHYPEAHFFSHRATVIDATDICICGDLTLRGVTRPLCMEVTINALKQNPFPPFLRTASFSALATISRREFGIDSWLIMGDSVQLTITAEAVCCLLKP
jgi:polyisoprenoid-binding protein YceI